MLKLFIGVALTVLNYDYEIGGRVIGIFPHFLGFFLIVLGIQELEKKDDAFSRALLPAYVFLVYSLAFYVAKTFGFSIYMEKKHIYVLYFMQLLETVGAMFVAYLITFAYTHYEHRLRMDVGCTRVQKMWKVMGIGFIIFYVGYMTALMYGSAFDAKVLENASADAVGGSLFASFVFYQLANVIKNATILIYLFFYYKATAGFMDSKK